MRLLFLYIVSLTLLFGSLSINEDYKVDQYIADSLDIPRTFLQSEKFRTFYKRYEKLKRHSFIDSDRVETYFIPMLEKILEAQGIPEIFLFMAMAESNFASHARSSKAAVGIWQFMPQTAKKYGLKINEFVDERKDPIKSTNAAVKYLKFLHKMFGKWYLAALAYNAGEGAVLRAIQKAGTDDLMVLLDPDKKYLPKESRLYILKIASLAKLSYDFESKMSHELEYILARGEDYSIVPVQVKSAETLTYISQQIQLKRDILQSLNPQLIRGFTPPQMGKYTIYIPRVKFEDFKKRYKPSNRYNNFLVHKVKKGESLYSIARKYGLRIATIKQFNNLKSNLLRVNKTLIIPIEKPRKKIYKVKSGDTLIKIAQRFGVEPKKLKEWNDKKDNFIKVGEKLVVLY